MKRRVLIVMFLALPFLMFSSDNFNSKLKEYLGKEIEVVMTVFGGDFKIYDYVKGVLEHVGEDYLVVRVFEKNNKGKVIFEGQAIIPGEKILRVKVLQNLLKPQE